MTASAPSGQHLDWAALSDLGQRRTNNEDSWGVLRPGPRPEALTAARVALAGSGALLIMSDGMGGARGGEIASSFCVEHLAAEIGARVEQPDAIQAMHEALVATHEALVRRADSNEEWHGMGATLSALWLQPGGRAVLGHVGDSRIYRSRGGLLEQLSEDHNVGASMLRRGEITAEAATRMKFRSLLEQAMGADGTPIDPQVRELDLAPGDVFVLCSDGLYGPLGEELEPLLRAKLADALPLAATALVAAAKAAGGPDNITVVLARLLPT